MGTVHAMSEPPSRLRTDDGFVRVRDARVHNLRGVDVDIPRDAIVAFTGVSGSGKSSLAFDTIFAEAQRRYFESVAPYARRLLQQVGAPKVGSIDGLPPAVALQQRRGNPGARSSVGTVTTMSNLLRMLFSRAGTYPSPDAPRLDSDAFSPNTAAGACPVCHGLGERHEPTEASMVPDPSLSIRDRAVAAWPGAWQGKNQRDILAVLGHDIDAPWHTLSQETRDWILFTEEQPVVVVDPVREVGRTQRPYKGQFMSARRYVMKALTMSQSASQRRRALQFVETSPCPSCGGTRLRADALAVRFADRSIAELGALSLTELADVLRPFADAAHADVNVAAGICADLVERAAVLTGLGLGYLSLDRPAPTLSPGELQRLRLATQLRTGLFGVVYVLDEPSAGLHPADTEPLTALIRDLRDAGNSIFVVEHDMDLVRTADWIVDVGPGAGSGGGDVLYSGPVDGLAMVAASRTRAYLCRDAAGHAASRDGRTPRSVGDAGWLELDGIELHNLHGVDVRVPCAAFTAVTGVSGSGKSSLALGAVAAAARQAARTSTAAGDAGAGEEDEDVVTQSATWTAARGFETLDRVVVVDQRPIGRTPRSNLATYTGLFDGIRRLFAATELATERGYGAGRFSFNVDGGRCPTCQGEGFVAVELLFLPGTYAPCSTCDGTRYEPATLEVRWRDHSIADVLALTVDAASELFADERAIARSLTVLRELGLGYLRLGQPATELSGGEAQRIKLASELQRARRGHALYVLDEPTTGLHPADAELLIEQLHRLVDHGHTVVVVEHDMGVVRDCDHVIDLGPGGGSAGGRIVATGTPRRLAADQDGATATYLARALAPTR